MSLRCSTDEKTLIMRAASIQHVNLTEYVVSNAVSIARKVVDDHERLKLSERDSIMVMDLLDNPPAPNKKMLSASKILPK